MKNPLSTKTDKFTLVSALPPASQMDIAGKINHFNQIAQQAGRLAIQAAIITGWLLSIEKAKRAGTFEAWCNANLDISRRTTYNYLLLFDKTVATHNDATIECSDKQRAELVAQYAAETDSRTLTELYTDLGIVKKSKSNLGGRREGAGRPRKVSAEEMAAQAAALVQDPTTVYAELTDALDKVEAIVIARDALALLDDGQIDKILDRFHDFSLRGANILSQRQREARAKSVAQKV